MPREILTLQVGDYANHVATHFWNLEWQNANFQTDEDTKNDNTQTSQQHTYDYNLTSNPSLSKNYQQLLASHKKHNNNSPSTSYKNINPDICFHSTSTHSKIKYYPRCVILAANGAEGNINDRYLANNEQKNDKYLQTIAEEARNVWTWNKGINVIQQPSIHQSNNNAIKNKYWTDFLQPKLHKRSLCSLPNIHHFSTPFHLYSSGLDLFQSNSYSSTEFVDEMEDQIRYFLEACDCYQGIQMFVSSYDSNAGLLQPMIEFLHDCYGCGNNNNKTLMVYNIQPAQKTIEKLNFMRNNSLNEKHYNHKQKTNVSAVLEQMRKRSHLNNVLAMAQIYENVCNILPINADFFYNHNSAMDLNQKRFLTTGVIGSCLHHYSSSVRLKTNKNLRLRDIINSTVIANSMKISMVSCNSSHLDLDLNFQCLQTMEQLFYDDHSPIFSRLSCLGPISKSNLSQSEWKSGEIFGEYSTLNGTDLYSISSKNMIENWKQKSRMAEEMDQNEIGRDLYGCRFSWEDKKMYALKLMNELAMNSKRVCKHLNWNLIHQPWQLPKYHPFYKHSNENVGFNDVVNEYSIWSSGWTSAVIGDCYLKGCADDIQKVIRYQDRVKMFGDCELDLHQVKDDLYSWTDLYSKKDVVD